VQKHITMSIANLHSVLNDRWFIQKQYGQSLIPSLFAIIKGQSVKIEGKDRKPEEFIFSLGNPMMAVSGSGESSQADYVLVTNIKNAIYKYDQECGPRGTKSKMQTLEYYKNDPNCKGIVLDIDSGGGQVSGTPEFHDYLLNFSKPVVAYTDGLLCSAAYYIASAADHIVANKRADHIGSIGTMLSFIDFTGYYEKQGAKVITEYATKSTEKNRAFEELLKGNPELIIAEELDPINEDFHADVKASRPGISEKVFTGATWNAADALDLNLIDSIGTLQDAIDKAFELAKPKNLSTNTNFNNMSNSKKLPRVEAVLGLEAPLAITDNGSFLNEEQLDTIEARFDTLESENSSLQTQVSEAISAQTTAVQAVQNELTEANNSLTATEASVDATLAAAGLPVEGTLTEKLTALNAYATEKGAEEGAAPTNARVPANADSALSVTDELSQAIKNS
jgi:protease-4